MDEQIQQILETVLGAERVDTFVLKLPVPVEELKHAIRLVFKAREQPPKQEENQGEMAR